MSFGDLKSDKGLNTLNDHLSDKSYIQGYEPTKLDSETYDSIGKSPASTYPHALRWYNHIASYGSDKKSFPTAKGPLSVANSITNGNAKGDAKAAADDDDIDLFGSDEEDEEAAKVKEQRLKEYAEKKSKKPGVIAKSSVVLDVKPWDDETDMSEMEKSVRSIEMDGLNWGASKLMPVGYGIKKLQIMCVVEDDKVSIEELQEKIEGFEDFVQSVDIAAFNKI